MQGLEAAAKKYSDKRCVMRTRSGTQAVFTPVSFTSLRNASKNEVEGNRG